MKKIKIKRIYKMNNLFVLLIKSSNIEFLKYSTDYNLFKKIKNRFHINYESLYPKYRILN